MRKKPTPRPIERGERVTTPDGDEATVVLLEARSSVTAALVHVPALPLGARYLILNAAKLVRA